MGGVAAGVCGYAWLRVRGAVVAAELVFGAGGNARAHTLGGWSAPEAGFTWSIGGSSELLLPVPRTGGLLELHVQPFVAKGLSGQWLAVAVEGFEIGRVHLRDEVVLWFSLPERAAGATVTLQFQHPDATAPADLGVSADTRVLAFQFRRVSVRAATAVGPCAARVRGPLPGDTRDALAEAARGCTGLALHELAACFESLGRNCELGLVQRHFGAEPLGLLRFASIQPAGLLAGLREGFAALGEVGALEVYQLPDDPSREWMLRDRRYGSESHTFQSDAVINREMVLHRAERRFALLQRKFIETMWEGSRICVFQHPHVDDVAVVRPLAAALRGLGPAVLLWVSEDRTRPAGSVAMRADGILHGAIDKLAADGQAGESNLLAWTSILANSYRLWREAGFGGE